MDSAHAGWLRLVGIAGLLPFIMAVGAHVVWPSQPRVIETPPRPALAFHQYLVDLGRIEPTSEERGTFLFRNRGSNPVQITSVEPSCGCLNPYVSSHTIEPGADGRIVLRIQPANEAPGRKEFYADVKYADPQPREVRLSFKLEIPEQGLSVRPRALLVYQGGDRAVKEQIVVTDTRSSPARVQEVSVNNSIVQVALGDSRTTESGGIEQAVDVAVPAGLLAGRHEAIVTIRTDDPQMPVLRVPLRIESRPVSAEAVQP